MKKKVILILLLGCLISTVTPFANVKASDGLINNHNVLINSKEYKNLESLGFNDYQILNMTQEEFNANKNLTAEIISVDTKYIKVLEYFDITEYNNYYNNNLKINYSIKEKSLDPIYVEEIELTKEQYNAETSADSNPYISKLPMNTNNGEIGNAKVTTAYKTMQTFIMKLSNDQYRVRNDLVWTKMPSNRDEDLIRLEVSSNVIPIDASRYGKQLWTICSGNDCEDGEQVYSAGSSKWADESAFYYRTLLPNLKNNEWRGLKHYTVSSLWIYMYYDLSKEHDETVYVLDAYGEYKHKVGSDYDSMPQTHAQARDVNW